MASVQDLVKQILLAAHPVGSYYWSSDSTDPASLFGGTWERITGRFVYAASGNSCGDTGGEATHKLTIAEMPLHGHRVHIHSGSATDSSHAVAKRIADDGVSIVNETEGGTVGGNYSWNSGAFYSYGTDREGFTGTGDPMGSTNRIGGGAAHNNLPPYITAFCWRRTA